MDSLLFAISNADSIRNKGNQIYYIARYGPRLLTLVNTNKTFEQLKNSGSFRLITNNETANRITAYYNRLPLINRLQELYFEEFTKYKQLVSKIFDPLVFRMMEIDNGEISRNASNPPLRSYDAELLKEFGIYIVYLNGTRRSIVPLEEDLMKNGSELISYLKKEYDLQ